MAADCDRPEPPDGRLPRVDPPRRRRAHRGRAPARRPPSRSWRASTALMLTGGGDVDPALYGEAPHATFQAAEAGRDEFEIALARAAVTQRHSPPRDLPRHAGAQRRDGRHAGAGHSQRGHRRARALGARAALPHRARSVGVERLAAGDAARGSHGGRRDLPRQQPPSPVGEGRWRRASRSRRRRPTASSKRWKSPTPPSASRCSGIRRISGAPASSARCSKASCRPLTRESDDRLDVRGVRKQIERARRPSDSRHRAARRASRASVAISHDT